MTAAVKTLSARSFFLAVPAPLKSDAITVFAFLSMLLIGADRFGLRAGGMTLRVVFPVLMAACSLLYLRYQQDIRFPKALMVLFLLWGLAGAASSFGSYDPVKSVGYTIWILFNFFIIITLFYNYARYREPSETLSLWFLVFRIHGVLVILEVARNILAGTPGDRPHLWFYEPSYLAIFMTAYFGSALFMLLRQGRALLPDFLLSALTMLLLVSATGLFGIMFAILLNFILARQRWKLFAGTVILGGLGIGTLFLFFQKTAYYQLMIGFLFSGNADVLDLILLRAGNRVVRILVGWQAFMQNPWLGIGVGADNAYMEANAIPEDAWHYIRPWTEVDVGQPFCNAFVSVLGSTGILGFIPFTGILVYAGVLLKRVRQGFSPEAAAVLIGFFCAFLAMQLDGTVQRYYLWSPLGIALGMVAYKNRNVRPSGMEVR